ncbi:MAG: hypothetical protein QOE05_215 [Actinomycetota bacterium]|jgi:hypothetical protein|nr:hypothetical protein [Actinomycetota bacterium]
MQPIATFVRRSTAVLLGVVVLSATGVSAASADDVQPTLPRCYEVQIYTPPSQPDPIVEVCYPL